MAKFIKIEMVNKADYPRPVPINFDHVISLTPHLIEPNRYMMCFDGGGHYDAFIPDELVDRLCDV